MTIIIDTNIVFSAILNSRGKIGQILTLGQDTYRFFSIELLKNEIHNHFDRLQKLSGLSTNQLMNTIDIFTMRIMFVDSIVISDQEVEEALRLTRDIDENDTLFVALTRHLNGLLWTGDKQLMQGLKTKGYQKLISTEALYQDFLSKKRKF